MVVYLAIDVALAFLRTDRSLLHSAESDYGNGPWSWLMDANFLVRCAFSLAAAASIHLSLQRRPLVRAGVVLVAVWAVLSGVLAFFRDDLPGSPVTGHGLVHLAAALVAFLACGVGTLLLTIDARAGGRLQPIAAVLAVLWALAAVGFVALTLGGFGPHSLAGLFERVFLGSEILWLLLVAVRIGSAPEPLVA